MPHNITFNTRIKDAFATLRQEFQQQMTDAEVVSIDSLQLTLRPKPAASHLAAMPAVVAGDTHCEHCHNTDQGMVCVKC
jgi:hypothetical protein